MRRLLRNVVIALVLGTVIAVGIQYATVSSAVSAAQAAENTVIDAMIVERGDLEVNVSASGSLLPERQVPLLFGASAPVTEILVQTGERVQEGDVIARLDRTDALATVESAGLAVELQQVTFDALTQPPREVDLAAAEAAVNAAQASYNAAASTAPSDNEVEIARLQAELSKNRLWQTQLQADGFDPASIPLPEDTPPEITDFINGQVNAFNQQNRSSLSTALTQLEYGVDIAETNYAGIQQEGADLGALNTANAAVVQANIAYEQLLEGADEVTLQNTQIDLETAQLALEQAEAALTASEIVAPFDGVIAQNNLALNQLPPTEEVAVLLIDDSAYYVDLAIDETDIVNVEVGQPVRVEIDALPDAEITGEVTRVAQTPTRVAQLVTYLVRVQLDDTSTNAPLRVGMSATARIATEQRDEVLLVRNNFIRIDRLTGQAFVTIRNREGLFEEIPVELGARNETFSEIVSGLEAGQEVVRLPRETFIPGVQ